MSGSVHFWTLHELDSWDPDEEPDRFLSGFGHSFLEPYVRLKARGFPVTIGRRPAGGSRALVASLEELTLWRGRVLSSPGARLAIAAVRCPTVVLIRGDQPLSISPPRYIRTEVMPNAGVITDSPRQVTLPVLPQRGMIPRRPDRRHCVERLAIKAYRHNLPRSVLDPVFAGKLEAMGIELRIETEADEPSRWPDFRDVDAVLCVHAAFDTGKAPVNKPATKVVNAWCAGVIPIVAPEPGYLEVIDEGMDAIVVRDIDEVEAALRHLRDNPEAVRRLLAHGQEKAAKWSTDAVLEQWQRLLSSELRRANRIWPFISAVANATTMAGERLRQD